MDLPSPDTFTPFDVCPICGVGSFQRLFVVAGFPICRCAGCGVGFVDAQIPDVVLGNYYNTCDDSVYDDPENAQCLRYYYLRLKNLLAARIKTGTLLDVGCSGGQFLDCMSEFEAYGIEISPHYAEKARARFGDRIYWGTLESYPEHPRFFDLITILDTLDHMKDPVRALAKCHRMLRPGGFVAVKVHNLSCLWAKVTGSKFYAIIPPYHLFYFDGSSLTSLLSKTGYAVLDQQFIPHLLMIKTVFHRLARGDANSLAHRAYLMLRDTRIGRVRVYKNLHDIITVLAQKHG
jgi:SAM-dependent methyltransferase